MRQTQAPEAGSRYPTGGAQGTAPWVPEALYVHVPFCSRKCPYCDFYSVAGRQDQITRYVQAVREELRRVGGEQELGPFRTVYFGGGTPTLLPANEIASLLVMIRDLFGITEHAEITCESNPGTVSRDSLAALNAAGVNRLSIGAQSFDDRDLRFLERIHSTEQARQAVEDAREAGFANLSLDLIYGLPDQTAERWQQTLQAALELAPNHLSAYCLQVEEGTLLAQRVRAGEFCLPTDDEQAELYLLTGAVLQEAGLAQYEVSSYSRPGAECRHNLTYWRNEAYLGVGASAWSFVRGERRQNVADLDAYLACCEAGECPVVYREQCGDWSAANETLMMGLRLAEGIDLTAFRMRHGIDLMLTRASIIGHLCQEGLADLQDGRLRLTPRGMLLAAEITATLAFAEKEWCP
ncbi:MAG: radical SAM family heme chaperone HemW [Candidatus Zipacnadales bacterium]